ncbi:TrkH family potassium uptake protein [Thermocrinis sp.]
MGIFELTPHRLILLSYVSVILIGSILLLLPFSTYRDISLLDALFTATSATTVTGLVVVDISSTFTPFGQLVILLLIQIGGLGYMGFTTYFLILLRRKLSLRDRLLLAESMSYPGIHGLVRFIKRLVPVVFLIELVGAFFLFLFFFKDFSNPLSALWYGIFHSVSAFNNAGFSVLPQGFGPYRGNIPINLILSVLIILGGLGFYVIQELILYYRGQVLRLSTHTKIVLTFSALLLLLGFILLLMETIRWNEFSLKERILVAFFHSASARTAGFNTVDLRNFSEGSLFWIIVLMFIGTGPGGTGGGIKITTAVVIFLVVHSYLSGKNQVVIFDRSITEATVQRAITIFTLSFAYTTLVALLLTKLEETPLLPTLFETVSAFSSVGLSTGNPQGLSFCADFSPIGKMLIIITMLMGRVGILSFMLAIYGKGRESRVKPPEARILL